MPSDLALKAMNAVHRGLLAMSFGRIGWQAAGMPDGADKISGTDPIVLSTAAYAKKTSFTGWSLTGAADVIYGFVPSGEATAKLIGVSLVVRRTG